MLDVALKYGYDTPESFAKAFRKVHGISPSQARGAGASLKAFPRLSFHITLKGDKDMDYRIVDKPAFKVVGKALKTTTIENQNLQDIPKFWGECWQNGDGNRLSSMIDDKGQFGDSLLGICMDYSREQEEFTYLIAVEKGENFAGAVPEGFVEKLIPAATWAIFESIGPMPNAIQEVWKRIFSEWFPSTGYEHSGGPELEVYPPPKGSTSDADYRCEVWIPIVKR